MFVSERGKSCSIMCVLYIIYRFVDGGRPAMVLMRRGFRIAKRLARAWENVKRVTRWLRDACRGIRYVREKKSKHMKY